MSLIYSQWSSPLCKNNYLHALWWVLVILWWILQSILLSESIWENYFMFIAKRNSIRKLVLASVSDVVSQSMIQDITAQQLSDWSSLSVWSLSGVWVELSRPWIAALVLTVEIVKNLAHHFSIMTMMLLLCNLLNYKLLVAFKFALLFWHAMLW